MIIKELIWGIFIKINMESKCSSTATKHVSSKYWKAIKFAVAVACIRSKPLGLSAEEYALQLHLLYWKHHLIFPVTTMHSSLHNHSLEIVSMKQCFDIESDRCSILLIKNIVKYNAVKQIVENFDETVRNFDFENFENNLVDICLSLVKNLKNHLSQLQSLFREILPHDTLLHAVTSFCKAVQFLEKHKGSKNLFVTAQERRLCEIVSEAVDLISVLCIGIMKSSQFVMKKLCFMFLCFLMECRSFKFVVAKHLLYWICHVKKHLIDVTQNEWQETIITYDYLNNISCMLKLYKMFLLSFKQNKNALQRTGSSSVKQSANTIDQNFWLGAKKNLEESIFDCSSRYSIFSNYVVYLGFITSIISLKKDDDNED